MGSGNITKAADLRNQTPDELGQFIRTREDELLKLKFQHATGQLENTAKKKQVRREIARARTILSEKQRGS
ncbi:MAG: 50S ribosomal protein L29 [Deltaproteobacteria bacterium]|nr:50S ribosomal protein L29 [Deltaproteobacteria bacterium]